MASCASLRSYTNAPVSSQRRDAWKSVEGTSKEECWKLYVEKLLGVRSASAPETMCSLTLIADVYHSCSRTLATTRASRRLRQLERTPMITQCIIQEMSSHGPSRQCSYSCPRRTPKINRCKSRLANELSKDSPQGGTGAEPTDMAAVQRCFPAADIHSGQRSVQGNIHCRLGPLLIAHMNTIDQGTSTNRFIA